MAEGTFRIPNISCGHCVRTIEREVGEVDGVRSVRAQERARTVTVQWDEDRTDRAAIEELLGEIGYPPAR